MLKRKCGVILGLMLGMTLILSGCASAKLAGAFDKQTVEDTAKKIVKDVNKSDYASISNMFSKDTQAAVPADKFKQDIQNALGDPGAFKDFKKIEVVGRKDKKTDEDIATALVAAEYKNKKIIYAISFDKDMKVSGFHIQ